MRRVLLAAGFLAVASPLFAQSALGPLGSPDEVFRAWIEKTDLARMLKRDTSDLRVMKTPDGAQIAFTGEGFRDVMITTVDDKGQTVTTCVNSVEGARGVLVPRIKDR